MGNRSGSRSPGTALPPTLALWVVCAVLPLRADAEPTLIVPELPRMGPSSPEAVGLAEAAYARVEQYHGAGDLAGALAAADEAWAAVPNASTALLRATILAGQGRHAEVVAAALQAADLDPTFEEMALVEEHLRRSAAATVPPLGWARLQTTPAGATLTVGGHRLTAPRTIALSEPIEVVAEAPGHAPSTTRVTPRPGAEVSTLIALAQAPQEPRPAPVVAGKPAPPSPRVLEWTLIGAGGAMIAAAVGLHVAALDASEDAGRYAAPVTGMTDEERRSRWEDADSSMRAYGYSAYALYGVGAASAITGVALFFATGDDDTAVAPLATPGGAGFVLSGCF
ncbi:MAG: hypothetical protein AMXMBFR64_33940 [Myxococcales bacterium]